MENLMVMANVVVAFSGSTTTGDLVTDACRERFELVDPGYPVPEVLNVDLTAYGLVPQLGCVFIKDWSEHSGLTASLEALGAVEILRTISVGPFHSRAYEVRILVPEAARV